MFELVRKELDGFSIPSDKLYIAKKGNKEILQKGTNVFYVNTKLLNCLLGSCGGLFATNQKTGLAIFGHFMLLNNIDCILQETNMMLGEILAKNGIMKIKNNFYIFDNFYIFGCDNINEKYKFSKEQYDICQRLIDIMKINKKNVFVHDQQGKLKGTGWQFNFDTQKLGRRKINQDKITDYKKPLFIQK